MNVKQVIVMRADLNMRKGKMCAQAAHASMKVFFDRNREPQTPEEEYTLVIPLTDDMHDWALGLFTKVVVRCESESELLVLYTQALKSELPASLIRDAGLTEFGGVPTYTCIAIGPARSDLIDQITGGLKLL